MFCPFIERKRKKNCHQKQEILDRGSDYPLCPGVDFQLYQGQTWKAGCVLPKAGNEGPLTTVLI